MERSIFPAKCATPENVADMRAWVHGDVDMHDADKPLEGSIVCSTVARAEEDNNAMLRQLAGDVVELLCSDEVVPVRDGKERFKAASAHRGDVTRHPRVRAAALAAALESATPAAMCAPFCLRQRCIEFVATRASALQHFTTQRSSTHCTQRRRRLCLTTCTVGLSVLLLRHSDLHFCHRCIRIKH